MACRMGSCVSCVIAVSVGNDPGFFEEDNPLSLRTAVDFVDRFNFCPDCGRDLTQFWEAYDRGTTTP